VKENGHDAIPNIVSETISDWATFTEFVDDVVQNRDTDYKELKVVIYDTIDDLFELAEKEVIRLSNRKDPSKQIDSINSAFGGFGRGQDKAIELVIDKLWELRSLGIGIFIVGHTKVRTLSDPTTGEEYEMLTTNISNKYFNAVKNKLHILGVASIERDIKKISKGKNAFTGKLESKGVVQEEKRIISFRDDNYSVDSKSRFAEIKPKIKLDANEFIEAIKEAITLAYSKQESGESIEEAKEKQDKFKEEEIRNNQAKSVKAVEDRKLKEMIETIFDRFNELKTTPSKLKPFTEAFKAMGFVKADEISSLSYEQAEELLKLL
jgi:hypothetical protein